MPAPAVAAMPALPVIRGGENHAPEFIEIIIFAFDGLRFGNFHARQLNRRLAEFHQTLPAQTRAYRMRLRQPPLHLGGNGEPLAPARPLVGAAVGDAARVLLAARRTELFRR